MTQHDNANQQVSAKLTGTLWTVITINTQSVVATENNKPLSLSLQADEHKVSGFAGCNNMMGSYTNNKTSNNDKTLLFGPIASTRRMCAKGMEQEYSYLNALQAVTRYAIEGNRLSLYNQHDQPLIEFVSTDIN